ncbi:hypothetical protein D3C73_712120 [compost metagenome]
MTVSEEMKGACDCIDKVNALLAEQNAEIVATLGLFGARRRPAIETAKVESRKRGKSPRLIASFCPFCGEKYEAASAVQSSRATGEDRSEKGGAL